MKTLARTALAISIAATHLLTLAVAAQNPPFPATDVTCDFAVPGASVLLDRLNIQVDPAKPRVFIYTNKLGAFFAGQTSGPNTNENQGFNVYGRKVLEGYALVVDGKPLDSASATSVEVAPHGLIRTYNGALREEVVLLDGQDTLVVSVSMAGQRTITLVPHIAGKPDPADYHVVTEDAGLTVTPKTGGDIRQATPRSIAISASGPGPATRVEAGPAGTGFVPGAVQVSGTGVFRFVIAAGSTAESARAQRDRAASAAEQLIQARKSRLGALLVNSYVQTDDPAFDKALAWLKISGDALITNQAGPGIWAGLYWFNNYWGRDTFISLPGLTLVTGQFADARAILESFSKYQKIDPKDPLYGRIPNRVNSETDVIYNTVDGTPWFVREAYEYTLYSGDRDFARKIYPAVKRATEGTLDHRTDRFGFLTHDDADTWMDAKWEGKTPWSPRGNRAVDVQALWYAQLEASERLALLNGDEASARKWRLAAARLRASFRLMFRDKKTGLLTDHLNEDGSKDTQVRPNQIFALTVPMRELLSASEGAPIVRQVVNELTYRHGVASLAQTDENFHPFHHDERWYFDSAYHNGTVWVWNAGPVVSALCRYRRQDLAYELTQSMVTQTLEIGAAGTLSELIEAIPRDGRLKLSGTETQAWSIAEFIRVFYQDYLGVHPDALKSTLSIRPRLPAKLGTVRAVIPFGDARIKVTMQGTGETRCALYAAMLHDDVSVRVPAPLGGFVEAGTLVRRRQLLAAIPRLSDGERVNLNDLQFVEPKILPGLRPFTGINRRPQ